MKKKIVLLIIFFCVVKTYCQNKSGTVVYRYKIEDNYIDKKIINKEKNFNLKNTMNYINSSMKQNQSKLFFNLEFNNTKSKYYMSKVLNLDKDKQLNYAIILNKGKDVFYQDTNKKLLINEVDLIGEKINVKYDLNSIEWNLTQEKKKIGEYMCYKATAEIQLNKKIKIEAWFSPEIPLAFGPKGYGGLPGLIVNLKENNIIYYAEKIKLNLAKEQKINFPSEKSLVTKDEFTTIMIDIEKKIKKRAEMIKNKN